MSKIERINKIEFSPLDNISHNREGFSEFLQEKKDKRNPDKKDEEKFKKQNTRVVQKNSEILEPALDLSLINKQRNSLNEINIASVENQSSVLAREKLKDKIENLYVKPFEEKKNILK